MSDFQKKVYTMDDNIRYMSFHLKDLVKEFQQLNTTLSLILQALPTKDAGPPPF